jgi:hypothetical protein
MHGTLFFFFLLLGTKCRALHVRGKCSATEPTRSPPQLFWHAFFPGADQQVLTSWAMPTVSTLQLFSYVALSTHGHWVLKKPGSYLMKRSSFTSKTVCIFSYLNHKSAKQHSPNEKHLHPLAVNEPSLLESLNYPKSTKPKNQGN